MTTENLELAAKLGKREWRIDNLYHIQDARGRDITFVRNPAQRTYWDAQWYLNIILKARQLGFSTEILMQTLDSCLFNPNTSAGIIDLTIDDAKLKLSKIKFAYDRLPEELKSRIGVIKANTEEMEWTNGSSIRVGTSHRGGTLQILHASEFGKIAAQSPEKAREIVTGAFGAVHAGQCIHVESTAAGTGGEFYEMVQRAEHRAKDKRPLSQLDFKLHFFPWYKEPSYRLPVNEVVVIGEIVEYFKELEKLRGIKLDPEQRAWYMAKRNQVGPDDMFREYPTTSEEAFKSSIEGAYFKREMAKMRADGRIGPMPHDPTRKVNTFWDIGHADPNAIIFHQTDGVRHRFIDYYENDGEGLAHCISVLKEKKEKLGYDYGKHYGPHDLGQTDWSVDENKTRAEIAESRGIKFEVVPRIMFKGDAIEALRRMLAMTWIDEVQGARLIQCLDNYRKEWNEQRGIWRDQPCHDWASHGADCAMTGAMGYEPEMRSRRDRQDRNTNASSWAA